MTETEAQDVSDAIQATGASEDLDTTDTEAPARKTGDREDRLVAEGEIAGD